MADRIKEALSTRGWSQSELARRVGITQGAISQIALGTSRQSKHLPEIARHLGVSYEWLIGHQDELGYVGRPVPDERLSVEEASFIRQVRALQGRDRAALLKVAGGYIESQLMSDTKSDLPEEAVLAQMFEGILAGINPDADRAEQALLLAQSLPSGLAQTREFLNPTKVHRSAPRRSAPVAPTRPAEDQRRQST